MALGFIGKLLSGPIIDKAIDLFQGYQDKKLTKDQLRFELETLTERQAHEINLGQLEVNKEEAKTGSLFIGGWRPAVGWICALGFGVNFLIGPLATFIAGLMGSTVVFPTLDLGEMLPVLFGMLGLGAYRTVEKTKGVAKEKK